MKKTQSGKHIQNPKIRRDTSILRKSFSIFFWMFFFEIWKNKYIFWRNKRVPLDFSHRQFGPENGSGGVLPVTREEWLRVGVRGIFLANSDGKAYALLDFVYGQHAFRITTVKNWSHPGPCTTLGARHCTWPRRTRPPANITIPT